MWAPSSTITLTSDEVDMTNPMTLPPLESLKDQAKRLRSTLGEQGTTLSHSQSLELMAQQHGFRDWNTLRARAESNAPVDRLRVGDLIAGTYLGQAFTGRILGLSAYGDDGHYHIRMHFDEAVDVVTFDSFSSFRQRVRGVVDRFGRSPRKTSNGQPHIELKL